MAQDIIRDYGTTSIDFNKDPMTSKIHDMLEIRNELDEEELEKILLPSIEEMVEEDLITEKLKSIADTYYGQGNNTEKAEKYDDKLIKDAAYYTENPPTTTLGYHQNMGIFVLRKEGPIEVSQKELDLNEFDGDTYAFKVNELDDGGKSFVFNNKEYESFKDFCDSFGDRIISHYKSKDVEPKITVRTLGIDCPEIPHRSEMLVRKDDFHPEKFSIEEIEKIMKRNLVFEYEKNVHPGISGQYQEAKERSKTEKIEFIKTVKDGVTTYREIVKRRDAIEIHPLDIKPTDTAEIEAEKRKEFEIYKQCYSLYICAKDESEAKTLDGAYRAKDIAMDTLKNAEDIYVVINAETLNRSSAFAVSRIKTLVGSWWYSAEVLKDILSHWPTGLSNIGSTRTAYMPAGTDIYGRFLAVVYVKKKGSKDYVNLNKLILSNENTHTIGNKAFSSSAELKALYGSVPDIFRIWSYQRDTFKFIDEFEEVAGSQYDKKNEFHKEILGGMEWQKLRSCYVMLGDTLMLIPPTSIRNISQSSYERVPVMRGRGTMQKDKGTRETAIELQMYFYADRGINGIEKKVKTPSGTELVYKMNGLRSLLAQFKVAPFLPIENEHINDVLGIEAVSLMGIQVNTVEGYPQLLQATITLREFKYRLYMPDLPLEDNPESEDSTTITQMNPMFAKCFNWEVFRFYYQRLIARGDALKDIAKSGEDGFASDTYSEAIYNHSNNVQPVRFCNSNINFYTPSEDWLSQALQVKKQRDLDKTNIKKVKLNDTGVKYLRELNKVSEAARTMLRDKDFKDKANELIALQQREKDRYTVKIKNAFKDNLYPFDSNTSNMYLLKSNGDSGTVEDSKFINNHLNKMFGNILAKLSNSNVIKVAKLRETMQDGTFVFAIELHLDASSIALAEYNKVREVLAQSVNDKAQNTMKNNVIELTINMAMDENRQMKITPSGTFTIGDTNGYKILTNIDQVIDDTSVSSDGAIDSQNTGLVENAQDYRNPKSMRFTSYLKNVLVSSITLSTSNNFTDISLKAVDGHAPQYMGGQDTQAEIVMLSAEPSTIAALNKLPALAAEISKEYRRVLTCWPLKIENEYLQLFGMNECLIDSMDVSNVEGYPGVYQIVMRVTSVDRSQRQRESLRKIDLNNSSYFDGNSGMSHELNTYFEIEKHLSKAELYPDLDLPTISELEKAGYRFMRYAGNDRIFPDPDFYISYNHIYTAKIIKEQVSKVFSELLEGSNGSDDHHTIQYADAMGLELRAKMSGAKGYEALSGTENEFVKTYDSLVASVAEELRKSDKKNSSNNIKKEAAAKVANILDLETLAMNNITEGFKLKEGYKAPLTHPTTNTAIETLGQEVEREGIKKVNNNKYAVEIKKIRKEAIEAIDDILNSPITTPSEKHTKKNKKYVDGLPKAVNELFVSNPKYNKLHKILFPTSDGTVAPATLGKFSDIGSIAAPTSNPAENKSIYFNPHFIHYMIGYTFSAACTLSGEYPFMGSTEDEQWHPRHIVMDNKFEDIKYKSDSNYMVNAYGDTINNKKEFLSLNECVENATRFGMFGTTIYATEDIMDLMKPKASPIVYLESRDAQAIYKDKKTGKESYRVGLLDPYYNYAGHKSQAGKEYKRGICTSPEVAVEAFIRVVLTWLKKMILDGLFFGEIDVIMQDIDELRDTVKKMEDGTYKGSIGNHGRNVKDNIGKYSYISDILESRARGEGDNVAGKQIKDKEQEDKDKARIDELNNKIDWYIKEYQRCFCARMIYPFMLAVSDKPKELYEMLEKRKYDELSSKILSVTNTNSEIADSVDKFFSACIGIEMLGKSFTDDDKKIGAAQRTYNSLVHDLYIKAAMDPRKYILHSFYDMLRNDKRGRLIKAFPTYYVMFVDEGRRIGTWKLFDNFYNMSSIASINVVKSRKIAADTCNIVMSNMFDSYAQQYSASTYQNYANMYGLRDVFDNIFSPITYFGKEDAIRRRMDTPDSIVFAPGVRMHVRMGYSSDAANLPIVFNGKIAEVGVEEVVNIVAQGDGHELMNPLNAFGDIETYSIREQADIISIGPRDLRGALARGGETPRNFLSLLLTAKYGGIKKFINEEFDGRWFSENPFGITHFGDWKYKEIFEEGEMVQNLYEVSDTISLKGNADFTPDINSKKASPIVNTTLQDKTFWDIMHLCCGTGIDYVTGIRDFNMRSTVFMGKPHYYYAYKYVKSNGKTVEKRKPFQQWHYYDSFTDIIYNTIKASDREMKTNAVGVWQQTSGVWGKKQASIEPIYLDMNIYPEYQKSMTVNTGLLAAGNGGIKIPLFAHFAEKWAFEANDDKVNKATAWRVTMNALRESVKDMYTGELCVLGDPCVKPHDRISVFDSYLDMQGQAEVETVIYSMNADTGFTTTIVPDAIVKHYGTDENMAHYWAGKSITLFSVNVGMRLLLINRFANHESVIAKSIAKAKNAGKFGAALSRIGKNINEGKMVQYLEKNPGVKNIFKQLSVAAGFTTDEVKFLRMLDLFKDFSKFGYLEDTLKDVAKSTRYILPQEGKILSENIKLLQRFENEGDMAKFFDELSKNHRVGASAEDITAYKRALEELKTLGPVNNALRNNLTTIAEAADVYKKQLETAMAYVKNPDDYAKLLSKFDAVANLGDAEVRLKKTTEIVHEILEHEELMGAIYKNVDSAPEFKTIFSRLRAMSNGAMGEVGADGTRFLTRAMSNLDKSDDLVKGIKALFKLGSAFNIVSIVWMVVQTAIEIIVTNNIREMTTRWMKNIQALVVYPMKYNNNNLLAGMNGFAGSVFGAPPPDALNTIQGMVMQGVDFLDNSFGPLHGVSKMLMSWFIIDRAEYEKISNQWKLNLGIKEADETNEEELLQKTYDAVGNQLSAQNMTIKAIKTKRRITSYNTRDDNEAGKAYEKYKTININNEKDLSIHPQLKALKVVEADADIKKIMSESGTINPVFKIAHNEVATKKFPIEFESGRMQVPALIVSSKSALCEPNGAGDKFVYDLPLIREECLVILKEILHSSHLLETTVYFKSGVMANESRTWKNTGYAFILECKDSDKLQKAIEEVKEWSNFQGKSLFQYQKGAEGDSSKYAITVYAPKE